MKTRVLLLCLLSAAVVAGSPWLGRSLEGDTGRFILENLRIPRVLMAVLVGGTLSLVGACYQTISPTRWRHPARWAQRPARRWGHWSLWWPHRRWGSAWATACR